MSFLLRVLASLPLLAIPSVAAAQAPTQGTTPVLEALSPEEFAALRPFADRGGAILVRDPSAGIRARITVMVVAHAPRQTVYDVIARVEDYPQFFRSLDRLEVTARHANRIAFRLHTSVGIFSVDTVATLHLVNDHRIDGQLIESQLGPGGLRWDLYQGDGDVTYLAYSTWDDPTSGNWFLRQIAAASPDAIAGMEMSYDLMLALMTAQRAETLARTRVLVMPQRLAVPSGPIEAPVEGAWLDLVGDRIIAGVRLDAQGETLQTFVATHVASPLGAACARAEDVAHYNHWWRGIRELTLGARRDDTQRFHSRIESPLFSAQGDQDRVVERGDQHAVVWLRGVAGDYVDDSQRWDFFARPAGGTTVVLSGGNDFIRTGMIMRALVENVPWMLPGYSAAWKMVWTRQLLRGL
jgi:hypothetical protein